MRTTWNFYSAGRLVFGRGAVAALGRHVAELNVARVMVVTDPILVEVGVASPVTGSLKAAGLEVGVFDGGEAEPSFEAAAAAIEFAGEFRPDAVLGLGGGSNMDLAKITACVVSHGGSFEDYFHWDNVPGPVCPIIGVPTTSGTGSEVSHAAVLTDTANEMKVSTLSNHLRPRLAVVDPELTLTCPPKVTADSGIDALTHAIEAYLATRYSELDIPPNEAAPYDGKHPLGDILAEKAIRLIGRHLANAVRDPSDIEAREGMSLASTVAGLSFSNCGVALVHALEYPLGGTLHCSHGAGNGLLLPYVMRFNLPVRKRELADIAGFLGEDVSGLDEDAAAERGIDAVVKLRSQIGIPDRIRDLGGTEDMLPEFAKKSHAIGRLMLLTPRRPSLEDCLSVLQSAL